LAVLVVGGGLRKRASSTFTFIQAETPTTACTKETL